MHRSMMFRRRVPSTILVAVGLGVLALAPAAHPTGAEGRGRYQTLAAKWWAWAGGIPAASNPITDPTGEFCAEGQQGNTWFLAGNFGGTTTRECTIPQGTKLFFPVFNSVCAEFPAGP